EAPQAEPSDSQFEAPLQGVAPATGPIENSEEESDSAIETPAEPPPAAGRDSAAVSEAHPPADAQGDDTSAQPASEGIGRYMSLAEILLELDPQSAEWRRVPSRATLGAGEKLLALTGYRPSLTLATGIIVEPI